MNLTFLVCNISRFLQEECCIFIFFISFFKNIFDVFLFISGRRNGGGGGGGGGGGESDESEINSDNSDDEDPARPRPTDEEIEKMEDKLETAQADQKNLFLIIFQVCWDNKIDLEFNLPIFV